MTYGDLVSPAALTHDQLVALLDAKMYAPYLRRYGRPYPNADKWLDGPAADLLQRLGADVAAFEAEQSERRDEAEFQAIIAARGPEYRLRLERRLARAGETL